MTLILIFSSCPCPCPCSWFRGLCWAANMAWGDLTFIKLEVALDVDASIPAWIPQSKNRTVQVDYQPWTFYWMKSYFFFIYVVMLWIEWVYWYNVQRFKHWTKLYVFGNVIANEWTVIRLKNCLSILWLVEIIDSQLVLRFKTTSIAW